MQNNNLKNILAQAQKPGRFSVMSKKVLKRLFDSSGKHSQAENMAWLKSHCSSFEAIAQRLDADLWQESTQYAVALEKHADVILKDIEFDLGGGGGYPFLYFITRYLKPEIVVETGVAAGFSSHAFLSAIAANATGSLYSSDFPYFRLPRPERYIGIVVPESLKSNWSLYLEGDEVNLPKIFQQVNQVDIFHYDSDKSYSGRELAMTQAKSKMSSMGIILMDDIQDNSYFYDYIENNQPPAWHVFEFRGKYIGLIGDLKKSDP
ncbi:class I SAM-dependent methyltransferase [Halomicronema sp. CCY15110]|uniref:class I SAM-dependent methyltransferase n=1 Tax=Halomicronema sp. CCY15110 TaxID=2767773 RepID=UPI00194EF10C|nr:class I SAM-dependent methyltransferase [Halomicronema sp. CCY15110]